MKKENEKPKIREATAKQIRLMKRLGIFPKHKNTKSVLTSLGARKLIAIKLSEISLAKLTKQQP